MTNKILYPFKATRMTCTWVATGNPRKPLTCFWAEYYTQQQTSAASSPNEESGGMSLCA